MQNSETSRSGESLDQKRLQVISPILAGMCDTVGTLKGLMAGVYLGHSCPPMILRLNDACLLLILGSSNSLFSAISAVHAVGINVFLSLFPPTRTVGHLHKTHGLGR